MKRAIPLLLLAVLVSACIPETRTLSKTVPESMQGRWGLVPADCTSTAGDNKGLMTVSADSLRFYESTAEIAEVRERTETRLDAAFSFSGEGMVWARDMVLTVKDSGNTLIREESGPQALQPLTYARCG